MNHLQAMAMLFDPSAIMRACGLIPDPWQRRILLSSERQILLNCSRQSGKSTTVAALALHTALSRPRSLILLLSPSLRQSLELFRKVIECYAAVRQPIKTLAFNQTRLELDTHSRIVCLPGKEETIRSFSGVDLLVIDEAARVPDDLYRGGSADVGGVARPACLPEHAVR
jgi:tRNA(Met) C34 N-acetyltransferase TmcA